VILSVRSIILPNFIGPTILRSIDLRTVFQEHKRFLVQIAIEGDQTRKLDQILHDIQKRTVFQQHKHFLVQIAIEGDHRKARSAIPRYSKANCLPTTQTLLSVDCY
jgi:hypothetical protein